MLQDWEHGFVGNNSGTVSGLAKRASLARVMVAAFRPIYARRLREELANAA